MNRVCGSPSRRTHRRRRVATLPHDRLLTGGSLGGGLWDLRNHRHLASFPVTRPASLAVSSDGKSFAVGTSTGAVTIWNTSALQPEGEPIDAGGPVSAVTFSPDGSRLTIARGLLNSHAPMTAATTTHVWDVASRTPTNIELAGHASTIDALGESADGSLIAAGDGDGDVVLHDPEPEHRFPSSTRARAFSTSRSPPTAGEWRPERRAAASVSCTTFRIRRIRCS